MQMCRLVDTSCRCRPVSAAVHEMSDILNTGLDKQALAILVNLCEAGVNPEALAMGKCLPQDKLPLDGSETHVVGYIFHLSRVG